MDCEHVAQTWPLPVSSCTSGAAIPTPLLVIFSFSKRASEPQYPCPCCNLSPLVPFPLWQPASQLLIGLYTSILPNPRVSLTYRSAWEQFALRITELLSVASSARLVGWLWYAESCWLCVLQPSVSSGEAYPYVRALRVPHIASWCCALSDSVDDDRLHNCCGLYVSLDAPFGSPTLTNVLAILQRFLLALHAKGPVKNAKSSTCCLCWPS